MYLLGAAACPFREVEVAVVFPGEPCAPVGLTAATPASAAARPSPARLLMKHDVRWVFGGCQCTHLLTSSC